MNQFQYAEHERTRDIIEARRAVRDAWSEMLASVQQFMDAEITFKEQTDLYRERHRISAGKEMTVECLMDRSKDEIWQNSIVDCRYYRERTSMFALVHQAASDRLRELIPTQPPVNTDFLS